LYIIAIVGAYCCACCIGCCVYVCEVGLLPHTAVCVCVCDVRGFKFLLDIRQLAVEDGASVCVCVCVCVYVCVCVCCLPCIAIAT